MWACEICADNIETRIALIARGLDQGLALFHVDEANRQSLAADVMEPVRPHVDAFVPNLARARTFSAKDFAERRDGTSRLASSLMQELAPTMAIWAKLVAPYAEAVARHVARLAKNGLGMTVPIGPKPRWNGRGSRWDCGRSRNHQCPKHRTLCRS